VNFLPNRILLSQVHARARKHTDTHKLACKSSLVKIRCPLSWENIWPHILFFKIRASRSPAADHVCVCIYTMQYTNEYTYHSSPRQLAGEKKSASYNHKTTIWVSHEYYLNPEFHKIPARAF
jgi:hypothetical protein